MSRVLLLKDKEGASADEFFQIMQRYAKRNSSKCSLLHIKQVSLEDISAADIVFCIRGSTPYMYYLLELFKRQNKSVVYFLDDALKDMPRDSFMYPKRKGWHIKCVQESDVLLTTNPFIAEDYKDYIRNKRTAIIHTAVDELMPYKSHEGGIKIVYAASEWHIENYNKMIAPIVDELLERNKNKIDIYFVGFRPNGINDKRVHFVPCLCFRDYQIFMKNHNFDIGLAPLEKSSFSERKYFNKFIEYSKYGICGIYSDTYPYRFVVKNEENGILVSDEPKEWLRNIQKLIDDKNLRSNCIKNAQEYLLSEHCDETIFKRLDADIPEIKTVLQNKIDKRILFEPRVEKVIRFYPFLIKEKLYMFSYSIKNEGIKKAIGRIVKKIEGGSWK